MWEGRVCGCALFCLEIRGGRFVVSCVLVSRVGSGRVVRVRGGGWLLAEASRFVAGLRVRVFISARPATRRAGSSFPRLAPGDLHAFFPGVLFWTLGFRGGLRGETLRLVAGPRGGCADVRATESQSRLGVKGRRVGPREERVGGKRRGWVTRWRMRLAP